MNCLHFVLRVFMLSLTLEIYKSEMGIQITLISSFKRRQRKRFLSWVITTGKKFWFLKRQP